MAVMVLCAVSISACSSSDKDDDESQNGTDAGRKVEVSQSAIQGIPSGVTIDEVKATVYYDNDYVAIATTEWNNGFNLQLPESLPSAYLETLFDSDDVPDGVTMSGNAKGTYVDFEAYDADGEYLNDFYYGKWSNSENIECSFVYCDRDMTITGTEIYTFEEGGQCKYSVSLKKGWNRLYFIERQKSDDSWDDELTTSTPSGIAWTYGSPWGSDYYNSSRAKTVINRIGMK